MTDPVSKLPSCWDCKYNDRGYPCRDENGELRVQLLAREYASFNDIAETSKLPHASWWPWECINELVDEAPETAFTCILEALKLCRTDHQVSVLAAGPLENIVRKHGVLLISRIETEAKGNARFRFLLSGIWGQNDVDPEIWSRIQKAVELGPWLDGDDPDPRTPPGSVRKRREV